MTLQDVVNGLGSTKTEVAQTLRNAGVRGKRMTATSCPVANYVADRMPKGQGTRVSATPLMVVYTAEFNVKEFQTVQQPLGERVTTPIAVAEFISDFDFGLHTDLEK